MDDDKPNLHTATSRSWRSLKPEARRVRLQHTAAEDVLWQRLRGGALGIRFRRQHAIDRFIVDFLCIAAKLIIEVDGPVHDTQRAADAARQARLEALVTGYSDFRTIEC